jgi:hypothetical protein
VAGPPASQPLFAPKEEDVAAKATDADRAGLVAEAVIEASEVFVRALAPGAAAGAKTTCRTASAPMIVTHAAMAIVSGSGRRIVAPSFL